MPETSLKSSLPVLPIGENTSDKKEHAEKLSPFANSSSKILRYIGTRFNAENWFGSLIVPILMYTNFNFGMSGLVRKIDGKVQPDYSRSIPAFIIAAEKALSFFGGRGGKLPEGKTWFARIKNTFKEPNKSATQFEYLMQFLPKLYQTYGNIKLGLQAHGRKIEFRKNDKWISITREPSKNPHEKVRLVNGCLVFLWQMCIGYSYFGPHRKADAEQNNSKTVLSCSSDKVADKKDSSITKTITKIWKYNKMQLFGAVVSLMVSFVSLTEGLRKKDNSPEEAKRIIRGFFIGVGINISASYYDFTRIAKSNFNDDHSAKKNLFPEKDNVIGNSQKSFVKELKESRKVPVPLLNR